MKIEFYCPRWGSSHLPIEKFLSKAKVSGYDGVEIAEFDDLAGNPDDLSELLEKNGLKLVGQQWLPNAKEPMEEYLERFERQIRLVASFSPLFINSHTGRDYYPFEENCRVFARAQELSRELQVPIFHETHRGRALFSTSAANQFFHQFPDLRITADFSHWCVVSETLLEEEEEIVSEACSRSWHIHARVGGPQAAQVNHPGAEENREALEAHLSWWQSIVDHRKKDGLSHLTITTEFGPPPYLPTLPFTGQPVADQWELNTFMKDFLKDQLKP